MKYDLNRFIIAQQNNYAVALEEIKADYKCSHWMWYIFSQIAGLGHSPMSKKYEIVNLEEANIYIDNDCHRNNFIEIL